MDIPNNAVYQVITTVFIVLFLLLKLYLKVCKKLFLERKIHLLLEYVILQVTTGWQQCTRFRIAAVIRSVEVLC